MELTKTMPIIPFMVVMLVLSGLPFLISKIIFAVLVISVTFYYSYHAGLEHSLMHDKNENSNLELTFVSVIFAGALFACACTFRMWSDNLIVYLAVAIACLIYFFFYFTSKSAADSMDYEKPYDDKVYMGHVDQGVFPKPFFITESARMLHGIAFGVSGAVKTEGVLFPQLAHDIRTGKVQIIIDLKGDRTLKDKIYDFCKRYGREQDFHYFSLSKPEESQEYNPFAFGNPAQVKDKFVASLDMTEPYYKAIASLEFVKILENSGYLATLDQVTAKFSDEDKELRGLKAELELLERTPFAAKMETSYSILDIYNENKVFLLSLDDDSYPLMSKALGKILLNDLKALSGYIQGHIQKKDRKPISLVVDEIAAFISNEFLNFLSKTRSANIRAFMATQSVIGDFLELGEHIIKRIMDNTSLKVFMAAGDPDSAEYMANTIGTREVWKETKQIEGDITPESTGMGSLRAANEYLVSPNMIKRLQAGEGFVYIREGVILQKVNFDFALHDERVFKDQ